VAPPVQRRNVWLARTTRGPCSNAAKTLNRLKLAGVPQTCQRISAASEPKFTILQGHVGRYCCSVPHGCLSGLHSPHPKEILNYYLRGWCQFGNAGVTWNSNGIDLTRRFPCLVRGYISTGIQSSSIWLGDLQDETVILSVQIIRDILASRTTDDLRDWVHAAFIGHHQMTLDGSAVYQLSEQSTTVYSS